IVPALSLDGTLAVDVSMELLTGETFRHFIQLVLFGMNPFLMPDLVLVRDNPSIHHSEELREVVE
ncbi:hypothetical protein BS17DRAFT_665470, partial [Gyrodon lividus]